MMYLKVSHSLVVDSKIEDKVNLCFLVLLETCMVTNGYILGFPARNRLVSWSHVHLLGF